MPISKGAQAKISKKIKEGIDHGKTQEQAVAYAYSEARKAGYQVKDKPRKGKKK